MTRFLPPLIAASVIACGSSALPVEPRDVRFKDAAAVRVSPARSGEWLVLFETLQPQLLMTKPIRTAGLLGAAPEISRRFDAPEGWTLIDAVAHPSGDVSLLSLVLDAPPAYPLRLRITRVTPDGAVTDRELARLQPPSGAEEPPAFMASLDRARLVASGEDLYAVVRWANNAVQAYRLSGRSLDQAWATFVEPPAFLTFIGIIGGGFDNFHQGDTAFFVHADVDSAGNLLVAVLSSEEVIQSHDVFFGENLAAQTDPASYDFGLAVVTRVTAQGPRAGARLLGFPGRNKRLLNLRVAGSSVVLVGRIKISSEPGGWDGWLHASDAASGRLEYERSIDVQQGDMFWDVAPLDGGRLLAVGSTNYVQNPSGLSVSDSRDPLALVLGPSGEVQRRIDLPLGPAGRGNEAISARRGADGALAISGVHNAPGTHAEVFSDAFVVVRPQDF
jgi:hypothetical protein